MIHKMFKCETELGTQYEISAWQAMGSDTVNLRSRDEWGWSQDWPEIGLTGVWSEKLSEYARYGVKTMDQLIDYLFYVKA